MNDELPLDGPVTDPIKQSAETARVRAAEIKQQAEDAANASGIWIRLVEARDSGLWFRLRALIEEERVFFHRLRESGDPVVEPLEKLYKEAKEQTEDLLHSLPRDIEKLAKRESLPLDRTSRHPKYTFRDGFITLTIDEAKRVAKISNYETKLPDFPADITTIGEGLKREEVRLFSRKFDGAKFLQMLRATYVAILETERRPDGDPVPLRAIARTMASNDKGFRRDEFLIDLSKLAMEGPAEVSGYRFELQQTKDASQGMLLYGPAGRGMVNLLIFNKTTP